MAGPADFYSLNIKVLIVKSTGPGPLSDLRNNVLFNKNSNKHTRDNLDWVPTYRTCTLCFL